MEISSSSVTGALKFGLQIISSHKKPHLEIYHQVCNRFGPEHEFQVPNGIDGKEQVTHKLRTQDIFIQFTLVNIGGQRAENVKLNISGDLRRHNPREDYGDLFRAIIPQMAPGQVHFLFRFDDRDIMEYPEKGGKALGLKKQSLTITVEYDAPKSLLNFILALPNRIRKKRRFKTKYTFVPQMVSGDLPPAEYV